MPTPALLHRPVYESLAEQFARAIESGTLPKGARLLPHRKLADHLGLSVQTVSRAYEELIRRGLVEGEIGRGTFVLGAGAEARQPYLPERPGEVIDLSILKPVVEEMHLKRMREGFTWLAQNISASAALSFRPNMVMPHHLRVAAGWLAQQGIVADPAHILITNGATPALTAAFMSVAPSGAGIAAEALTHHSIMPLCSYLGLHLEGVAMDAEGMRPDGLEAVARKGLIRSIYLQPNVINPLANIMGADRRAELVAVARRHDLTIIENDILNVMIGDRPPAFASLAPERVLHVCGFTKITLPGMRLAYLAAPPRLATTVANRHLVAQWMATPPMVELLSHWITDGTVTALAAWQRGAMVQRHAVAQSVLGDAMPACHPHSLHLWLPLRNGWNEDRFVAQARLQGVAVAAGAPFRSSERGRQDAVRISLGSAKENDLRRGLQIVAAMLNTEAEVMMTPI
jgi:DNA-binding transcriptional MocR family regulator